MKNMMIDEDMAGTKLCPFSKNDDGTFGGCAGDQCMMWRQEFVHNQVTVTEGGNCSPMYSGPTVKGYCGLAEKPITVI